MVNKILAFLIVILLMAAPVVADECLLKITKIQNALVEVATISPTNIEEAKQLLNLGISLHEQGDHVGAIAALDQAKALLQI